MKISATLSVGICMACSARIWRVFPQVESNFAFRLPCSHKNVELGRERRSLSCSLSPRRYVSPASDLNAVFGVRLEACPANVASPVHCLRKRGWPAVQEAGQASPVAGQTRMAPSLRLDEQRPCAAAFLPPSPGLLHLHPSRSRHTKVLARPRTTRVYPCARLNPTDPAPQYVPLHVHSDFSLLDGASQLPSLVSRAAELNVPALALTDHGVLYGAVQLVRTCSKHGVKPIIGNEMYVVNESFESGERRDSKEYKPPKRYHLIVLAKNTKGYRNLVKLTTMAHLGGQVGRGIFARPCINKAQLFQHREGLIISSACLGGEIPQALLNDDLDAARNIASWYRDVFQDDFYLEIQDHGSDEDRKVNPHIIRLSRELGIKAIATNDSHFTSCLDAEAHDALICIQTGKMLADENRLHYAGNEYFKSVDEMRECFIDHLPSDAIEDALCNTLSVADKVEEYDLFGATRIPDFPIPLGFGMSHNSYLTHVSRKGLNARLAARVKAGLADPGAEQQYHDRLEHELEMIAEMGFSSYFLVVWDYVKHAKDRHIPVGPGRGSAAGSLVAFALRITDVDPIPFNLLFERFLNPERKSMPDIDTDFSVKGREEIISYVSKRYGSDRVAQIITFNRLTSKAVLKDVARVHDVPYAEADRLAKLIPVVRGKPATLSKMVSQDTPSKAFKKMVDLNPPYKTWIDKAMRIEGTNKTFGIHAAGVVISASPLTDIVPLSRAKHGETITQYAMEDVESLGLLKMDFLGLKNLTVIETALEFINEGRRKVGIEEDLDFSVDALPLDDSDTYKLLSEGELDGIFQLDASAGMRSIVRELRPSSLEDISSILALYRPGPLDAGLIPKFIRRKHGREPIEYDHPLLEPILRETYGIMVYQEQIMRIARDLAGYTLGQADILRRAMGKKKTADMEKERPRFIQGAKERGVSEQKATDLFDMMIKFAEYCFNKSHSTAYAYLTYQTAYLKANYPVEYTAALLRSNMNQSDKLVRYLADANVSGVRVSPPSVNKSDLGFIVDRTSETEAVVLFGLEAVKAVGESVGKTLLEERTARGPFANIIDLVERVNLRVLNKRAMGALIKAGAFDELHPNRKVLLDQLESVLALRRKLRDRKKRRESKDLSMQEEEAAAIADALEWERKEVELQQDSETKPDFPAMERLAGEKATMGFYASGHPLHNVQPLHKTLDCTCIEHVIGDASYSDQSQAEDHPSNLSHGLPDGSEVMILSCVTELKRMTTAKGKKMARWMIEDAAARLPGILFPASYDVAEQVCKDSVEETSSLDVSDPTSDTRSDSSSPHYVLEEDARVFVWGRVDRESSGSAQIIVDDVQRIEETTFLQATATYNPDRDSDVHLHVLRDRAARLLEVDLYDESPRQYLDPNGIIRKRRPRTMPLSEKRRIPLILRCLNEEGQVSSFRNAGNAVRFPKDCADLLISLKKSTGFAVELVSVGEEMPYNNKQLSDIEPKAKVPLEMRPHSTELHPDEQVRIRESESFRQTGPDDVTLSDSQGVVSVDAERKHERFGLKKHLTPIVHNLPGEESLLVAETAQSEEDVVFVGKIRLTKEEHKEFCVSRRVLTEDRVMTVESRQEESLRASLRRRNRATSVAKQTRTTVREELNADSPRVTGNLELDEPAPFSSRVSPLNEAGVSGRLSDIAEAALSLSGEDASQIDGGNEVTVNAETVSESLRNSTRSHSDVVRDMENGLSNEKCAFASLDERVALGKLGSATIVNGPESLEKLKLTAFEQYFRQGIEVEYGNQGMAGLLDAISLVSGTVVRSRCHPSFHICNATGLDLSQIDDRNITLRVSGQLLTAMDRLVLVSVDVREVKPSGTRKRVRSFGPVMMMSITEKVNKPLQLKTKKAQRCFELAKQRIEDAASEFEANSRQLTSRPARSSSSSPDSSIAETGPTTSFETKEMNMDAGSICDGGYVLGVMSRAAELSLNKCLCTSNSFATAIVGFVVTNPRVLVAACSAQIRAQLEETSMGSAVVKVEAAVLDSAGERSKCLATFKVSNSRLRGRDACSITADEDPLFRGAVVAASFRDSLAFLTSPA